MNGFDFVQEVASFFTLLLQQVSRISESEWEKAVKVSGWPRVRIIYYPEKAKYKVEWRFGNITRYRHLTKPQIKNLVKKPFSIVRKIAESFKGVELCQSK